MVEKISAITLKVASIVRFYGDVLGMDPVYGRPGRGDGSLALWQGPLCFVRQNALPGLDSSVELPMASRLRSNLAWFTILVVLNCLWLPSLWAQTLDSQSSDTNKSWAVTTESNGANTNPIRTTQAHTQSGNRTIDKQSFERLRSDGRYEAFEDTETETVQVNSSIVRTTRRTFGRGSSGERALLQVTEEEQKTAADGEVKAVRTTSTPDLNGGLQVVQREVANTRKTGPDAQETKTTVFLPGANGLSPATETVERQKRTNDHTVEFQKSTLLPDGAGNFQPYETREGTIKQDGKNQTTEDRVSRRDAEGNMSVVSRTVSKESEAASGEKRSTVETYSTDVPGSAPDGRLHLNQRVTTVRQSGTDGGQTTQQQVEQPNPGDPDAGLRITVQTTESARPAAGGTQQTRTIRSLDGSGNLGVVWVDMGKSDKPPAPPVQTPPPEKPNEKPK